jgi:hypothetical protein
MQSARRAYRILNQLLSVSGGESRNMSSVAKHYDVIVIGTVPERKTAQCFDVFN